MKIEDFDMNENADFRKLKNVYIPNWFYKDHFEYWLGRSLTDDQFQGFKDAMHDTSILDDISSLVADYLLCIDEEF